MQFVGYESCAGGDDHTPALVTAEGGSVATVPLTAGTTLEFVLGDRSCAGVVEGDTHRACDRESAPYCERHTSTWACARCRGTCSMPLDTCHEEHAVYLAAFAPDRFKVGVTRSWRLRTRLREQGADRAAHVHTVPDGKVARQLEAEYAREVPVPDRVRIPQKVSGFDRTVDEDAWESLLGAFDPIERFSFDYGLSLDAVPVQETVARGTVRGVKGRVLVLENAGTTFAVDLKDLVGYEVTEDDPQSDLQSSLGAFE